MASNLIGQHVQLGDPQVMQRLQAYGAADHPGHGSRSRRSARRAVLGNVVRAAATTQAVIDGFVAVGVLTAVALLIVVFRSAAPRGPASATPLFRPRTADPP